MGTGGPEVLKTQFVAIPSVGKGPAGFVGQINSCGERCGKLCFFMRMQASVFDMFLRFAKRYRSPGQPKSSSWKPSSALDRIRVKFPLTCLLYVYTWQSISVIGAIRDAKQRNNLLRTNVWNCVCCQRNLSQLVQENTPN